VIYVDGSGNKIIAFVIAFVIALVDLIDRIGLDQQEIGAILTKASTRPPKTRKEAAANSC
jgi:hypothetical protein